MAKITDWFNIRKNGIAQINFTSIQADRQPLADALEFIKLRPGNLNKGRSKLITDALIDYAHLLKEQDNQQGD